MRPALVARLQRREPQLGLSLPLPSVPVLSPVLGQVLGGAAPAASSPQATQPAAPPSSAPPSSPPPSSPPPPPPPPPSSPPPPPSSPPASGPSGGGSSGGGSAPISGGSSGAGGTGGSPSTGGSGGGGAPPASGGGNAQLSPQQGSSASTASSDPPSLPPSGASGTIGVLSVSGGTTFQVTPTGLAPVPLNNAQSLPSTGDTSPSNHAQSASGPFPSTTKGSTVLITPAGSQGASGSSSGSGASNGADSQHGGDASSGTGGADSSSSPQSRSHLSSAAVGGIVAVVIICLAFALIIFRKRYQRARALRHTEWINGNFSEKGPDTPPRITSMRSSWGTPIEHQLSDQFHQDIANALLKSDNAALNNPVPPYKFGDIGTPMQPTPVYSPTDNHHVYYPDDPFADLRAPAQPVKIMSSLPVRASLTSSESDPFDDANRYKLDDHGAKAPSQKTQVIFPPPATTDESVSTGLAIGSPKDFLQSPGFPVGFPDSPVSPTFAATGSLLYPRRASVKMPFQPSQERRDEVKLETGDQVTVVSVYEDGWAFIERETNNERGLVPLPCLELNKP